MIISLSFTDEWWSQYISIISMMNRYESNSPSSSPVNYSKFRMVLLRMQDVDLAYVSHTAMPVTMLWWDMAEGLFRHRFVDF